MSIVPARADDLPPTRDPAVLAAMSEAEFAAHLLASARWQARNLGRRAPEGVARAS